MKQFERSPNPARIDPRGWRLGWLVVPRLRAGEPVSERAERIRLRVNAGIYIVSSCAIAEAMLAHPDLVKSLGI